MKRSLLFVIVALVILVIGVILFWNSGGSGSVTSADGMVTVTGASGMSVSRVTASELTGMDLKEDGLLAYSFGPDNQLSSPATVTIKLPGAQTIPSFWHVSEKGFEPVENLHITTDGSNATATFTLTHFSGIIVNNLNALFTISASPGSREVEVGDSVPYLFKVQATENLVVISEKSGNVIMYYRIQKGSTYTVNGDGRTALTTRNRNFTPTTFDLPKKTLPVEQQYRAIRAFTCKHPGTEIIEFSKPLSIEYEEDYNFPGSGKGTHKATISLSFEDKYLCKEKAKSPDGSPSPENRGLEIRVKGLEKYEQK